ncbi:MAG: hypothetical protein ACK424_07320 [Candidatus Thermochlorobacter sp.]
MGVLQQEFVVQATVQQSVQTSHVHAEQQHAAEALLLSAALTCGKAQTPATANSVIATKDKIFLRISFYPQNF